MHLSQSIHRATQKPSRLFVHHINNKMTIFKPGEYIKQAVMWEKRKNTPVICFKGKWNPCYLSF